MSKLMFCTSKNFSSTSFLKGVQNMRVLFLFKNNNKKHIFEAVNKSDLLFSLKLNISMLLLSINCDLEC